MSPTDAIIPSEVFNFTGQSTIDTWNFKPRFQARGWSGYDKWSVDDILPLYAEDKRASRFISILAKNKVY